MTTSYEPAVEREDAPGDDLPTLELHDLESSALRVLRSLQLALLKHPVACQAAFNALLAEGRAFGATREGAEQRAKLERSQLLHRARLAFDFSTLSLLEQDAPDIMPSAYVDVFFMLSGSGRPDEILHKLFQHEMEHERD
jgi:hypothetical protein